jgi:membrane dipeptidase
MDGFNSIIVSTHQSRKMKLCAIVLCLVLSTEKSWSYPSSRFEEAAFEKYLEKARAVLDRVPLIDG